MNRKRKKVINERNIHKKAEELALKILDIKKQRRKLDAYGKKAESKFCKIYDIEEIDWMEIEMELLESKTANGHEKRIEI